MRIAREQARLLTKTFKKGSPLGLTETCIQKHKGVEGKDVSLHWGSLHCVGDIVGFQQPDLDFKAINLHSQIQASSPIHEITPACSYLCISYDAFCIGAKIVGLYLKKQCYPWDFNKA